MDLVHKYGDADLFLDNFDGEWMIDRINNFNKQFVEEIKGEPEVQVSPDAFVCLHMTGTMEVNKDNPEEGYIGPTKVVCVSLL